MRAQRQSKDGAQDSQTKRLRPREFPTECPGRQSMYSTSAMVMLFRLARRKASTARKLHKLMTWEVAGDVGDGSERHPDVTVPVRVVLAQVLGVLRVA